MSYIQNRIVNLYKPQGPTSFTMVNRVKRILKVKKAGHIGTLDPMAEGILPICLGQSTRIIQFLSPLPKHYQCTMELGSATDTQDSSGQVISTGDTSRITDNQLIDIFQRFTGEQKQVPPMYSAKKNKGIPLYKLARNGITIERKPVSVYFFAIEFESREGNRVKFEVHCSAGTYIRTLCHDIGQELGCGAHMSHLVRSGVGVFDLESSVTLEKLEETVEKKRDVLFSVEKALAFLPEIRIKDEFVKPLANGRALPKSSFVALPEKFEPGMSLRIVNDGNDSLLAIVESLVNQDQYQEMGLNEIAFKLKRVLVN
ncbi:MAG: tRNA pseudouridine(55) synthase TruB [Nitrospinota bacterium]